MKMTKEYKIEMQAMAKALRIAKEKGVDALEEELNMRGATKMPLTISAAKGSAWMEQIQNTTIETIMLMAVCVLKDEFGFGEKRLNQFLDRYAEKTECLRTGYVNWEDLQEEMKEKLGTDFNISALVNGHRGEEVIQRRQKELDEMTAKLRSAK